MLVSTGFSQGRRVALVAGMRQNEIIILPERQAERLYRELRNKKFRTENDERLFAALTIALGVRSQTYLDCTRLSAAELARLNCSSRLEASKCRVRKLR